MFVKSAVKEMYGDQSGEFVCGSWGLKAKKGFAQQESKQALIVQTLDNASVFNR